MFKLLWNIGDHSPSLFFKLFYCQIQPILTYGSEIWGLTRDLKEVEKLHLFAIKRFMGASVRTPRQLIYGESGRHPLFVTTFVKGITYWLKLTEMNPTRLPRQAYNMLLQLHYQGKNTWATQVCHVLYNHGFGFVWEAHGTGNRKQFLKIFQQRLIDCWQQEWRTEVNSKDLLGFYSVLNDIPQLSTHLQVITNFKLRCLYTRFKLGMSPLRARSLLFDNNAVHSPSCPFCKTVHETELHFLLACPYYINLRETYIPKKYYSPPSKYKLNILLANKDHRLPVRIALYIHKALKLRDTLS